MMKWKKYGQIFKHALIAGCTPTQLVRSFCWGMYIAFCPVPGGHTVIMLITKYLFNLHFPTLFLITSINNPWTMIPFYSIDYAFGYWFVHSFLGWNPGWEISLLKLFGMGKICIWSFLIGGNMLGIAAALLSYPLVSKLFNRLASRIHEYEVGNN